MRIWSMNDEPMQLIEGDFVFQAVSLMHYQKDTNGKHQMGFMDKSNRQLLLFLPDEQTDILRLLIGPEEKTDVLAIKEKPNDK